MARSFLHLSALVVSACALALPAIADNGRRGGYDHAARSGGITLFNGEGFRGEAVSFDGAVARLPRARFNDKASSISVSAGAWELCSDSDFRGRCEIVSRDVGDLRRIGLNNNISSIRPVGRGYGHQRRDRQNDRAYGHRSGRGNADVILFDGEHFEGRSLPISGAIARLGDVRGNDKASSIVVNRGTWLVCEHANFQGRCAIVDASTPRLRGVGLNNNISSIKPYRGDSHALYGGGGDRYSRRGWN